MKELSLVGGMSPTDLDELVDYGALTALASAEVEPLFSAEYARS